MSTVGASVRPGYGQTATTTAGTNPMQQQQQHPQPTPSASSSSYNTAMNKPPSSSSSKASLPPTHPISNAATVNPTHQSTNQHQQAQQQQQQQQPNGASVDKKAASHRPPKPHENHDIPLFALPIARELLNKKPLPLSDRSWYKTHILTNAVFELESRFVLKEVIGSGAYGQVW